MQKMLRETFPLAILAGICISIGCVVNLRVGGVAGAVLFAFGLTTVVYRSEEHTSELQSPQ